MKMQLLNEIHTMSGVGHNHHIYLSNYFCCQLCCFGMFQYSIISILNQKHIILNGICAGSIELEFLDSLGEIDIN